MLRKLAGNTGQVPDSYLVEKGADYQVEKRIFACGGFADVRRGRLAKKVVAVKTIRTALDSNTSKIRKVGTIADVQPRSTDVHGTPIPGLLQGVCALDVHFPSQPSGTHRNQYRLSDWSTFNDFRYDG